MRNENLEAKMHRSLTKPMTWGGLPRNVFLMFVLMSILIFILLRNSIGIAIVINGIIWFGCKYATTKDPQFFDIIWNHIKNDKGMYKAE
mgnify:FL=1|jgi:hypothetical protein